ncbi:hypothetical protein D3C71_2190110 [compost metagenome]
MTAMRTSLAFSMSFMSLPPVAAIEAAMKIDWYWISMKPIFEPHFGSSQSLKPFGAGEISLGL